MEEQLHYIRTKDGATVTATVFTPAMSNKRVMIMGPSASTVQQQYEYIARQLLVHQYTVITFDYRGTGKSGGDQIAGYCATLQQWARLDLDAVILFALNGWSQYEIIFVGHGFSGEIIGLAPASQYINRMVLLNSALSAGRHWPLKGRLRLQFIRIVLPLTSFIYGYYPGIRLGFLGNMPRGVAREWSSWCSHSNGLFDVYPDNNYLKLQIPILAINFSKNPFTPPCAINALLARFKNAHITRHSFSINGIAGDRVRANDLFRAGSLAAMLPELLLWLDENPMHSFAYRK